ncbi:MAG: beta-ketoacyl-[acyl-carrier-protein] synthase family protein [Myxococcota bacterium]|nr:beta-ketoacyl-[acyl-carrier-protein] synthase family protein [Myxococcota bacterium]
MLAFDPIAITGIGLATPLGHTAAEVYEALCQGRSAIAPIERFPTDVFPCRIGAVVTDFKARDWVSNRKNLKLMSTAVRLGLAGVKRAWSDAGLPLHSVAPERVGFFVGAGTAVGRTEDLVPAIQQATSETGFDTGAFGAEGMHRINPLWLLKGLSNNVLGFGSGDLNIQGVNQNYCNSGVSGLQAMGEAAWALNENRADVIIAGSADSAVNPLHYTGFGRLRALTTRDGPDAVRPFDADRCGFAPGEGAAFFVLERLANALARGAQIMGCIRAYSNACAGHALGSGDVDTVVASWKTCLKRADWRTTDVDLFYAHGNGTIKFDSIEASALRQVFGEHQPPVTSNKGQLGHTIAAGGPISVACALASMSGGKIPHIAHLQRLARDCQGIQAVHHAPLTKSVKRAMVHAAGLGGQTATLALELNP